MNLKQIRLSQSLSVPKLVELSGVPRRTIQQIELSGVCMVANAIKLADALGVTLDTLCRNNDSLATLTDAGGHGRPPLHSPR